MHKLIVFLVCLFSISANSLLTERFCQLCPEERRAIVEELITIADDYFRDRQFTQALPFYRDATLFIAEEDSPDIMLLVRANLGHIYCRAAICDESYSIKNEIQRFLSLHFFEVI
jgi:hypothetical protein